MTIIEYDVNIAEFHLSTKYDLDILLCGLTIASSENNINAHFRELSSC